MHASYLQSVLVLVASLGVQLANSLNLFSENLGDPSPELDWTSPESDPNDANVELFDDDSKAPLTDTILISDGCDTQKQSLFGDGLSLLGRDNAACQSPLPLSPDTLQLFQDPSSLEDLLQNSLSTPPDSSGLLSPEEEARQGMDPSNRDLSDADGESWKNYEGPTGPCDRFNRIWLPVPVCCDGPFKNFNNYGPQSWVEYDTVQNCDLLGRMY